MRRTIKRQDGHTCRKCLTNFGKKYLRQSYPVWYILMPSHFDELILGSRGQWKHLPVPAVSVYTGGTREEHGGNTGGNCLPGANVYKAAVFNGRKERGRGSRPSWMLAGWLITK